MAKFDIITAAGNAYKTSWASRQYLLRLAAVPVAIKLFCFTLASIYAGGSDGKDGNYILFMLILVPALIAEGWMLAHWVRFIVLGQTWPFRPTGDFDADRAMLSNRARGILSGMIVFVLINMAIGLLNDVVARVMMPYMPVDVSTADGADIPAFIPFLSILLLAFMFWGFRLLWLHIPFALNMDVKDYLRAVKGAGSSLHMIGAWLLCFVPFILIMKFVGPVFAAIPGQGGTFAVTILSILLDTAKSIIATAGITFGLREIFSGKGRVDRRV